jgi:TPR repeat protein
MVLLVALAFSCESAEEKSRQAEEKKKQFMEAEAAAREAQEAKEKRAALDAASVKCESKDAVGCLELGELRLKDKDEAGALQALDAGCALKHKAACMLGGKNSSNRSQALGRFQKGCNIGDAAACVAGVATIDAMRTANEPVDSATQNALLDRACNLGLGQVCTVLGVLSTESDVKLAASAFDRGCKAKEPTACLRLGELYKAGKVGKKKDKKKSKELFAKACELGLAEACQN